MVRLACLLLLAASVSSHAAPDGPDEAARELGREAARVVTDKGLMGRLEHVGSAVMEGAHTVSDRASDLVVNAMGFLGVPYRRGGNSAESGFDCSGFVRAMYEQTIGLVLPRRANEQAAATDKVDKQDLQPGDLVFFNTMRRAFSHVGIYVGGGKFIHAPKPGAQVRVEDMGGSYWARRFDGARRVAGGTDAPALGATAALPKP